MRNLTKDQVNSVIKESQSLRVLAIDLKRVTTEEELDEIINSLDGVVIALEGLFYTAG